MVPNAFSRPPPPWTRGGVFLKQALKRTSSALPSPLPQGTPPSSPSGEELTPGTLFPFSTSATHLRKRRNMIAFLVLQTAIRPSLSSQFFSFRQKKTALHSPFTSQNPRVQFSSAGVWGGGKTKCVPPSSPPLFSEGQCTIPIFDNVCLVASLPLPCSDGHPPKKQQSVPLFLLSFPPLDPVMSVTSPFISPFTAPLCSSTHPVFSLFL